MYGFSSPLGEFDCSELAAMNDNGNSFNEIADVIEAALTNPNLLFKLDLYEESI